MLINKVKSTIKKYNMLEKGDRVLVGLSGGPDSISLLHILSGLRKEYSMEIIIAHLDHKFRGEESVNDRKFCEAVAEKLGLSIVYEEIDVPKIAKERGISQEEAAREERYEFFRRICEKKNINKIALGHTKDDQAETVLMRLLRGSGMTGLVGISPVREMRGVKVIRPLIEVSRKEVEDFIKENSLEARHDSTNDNIIFTRNKVRHKLIPYLENEFNTNIKEVLTNMAENLREENMFLDKFARRRFKIMSKKSKRDRTELDLKKFKKEPLAVQKRILRLAIESIKGNLRRLTYQHWKEVEELIENRPGNSIVDLPGGINIVKNKGYIIVHKENS